MHACQHCRQQNELDRHARLVELGVAELREGLQRELSLDERLELAAEEQLLARLLDQIEERRFGLTA